jgi:hypothetical protein
LLRGHHTRRRSSAALPIAPIVSGNWYDFNFQLSLAREVFSLLLHWALLIWLFYVKDPLLQTQRRC